MKINFKYNRKLFFYLFSVLLILLFFYGSAIHLKSSHVKYFVIKKNNNDEQLQYTVLVNKFYSERGNLPFWVRPEKEAKLLRQQLITLIDSSVFYGLITKKFHYAEIKSGLDKSSEDSTTILNLDRIYTDAAIATMLDILGYKLSPWVGFDPVSEKNEKSKGDFIIASLQSIRTAADLSRLINSLEPYEKDYIFLKEELKSQIIKKDTKSIHQLVTSMNLYRWIHHFRFGKFIVVNIPSATLRYYEKDSVMLSMKVVVGKPSTPTPRFTAYFDEVILYPYWYVPRSIIFKEFLPKMKRSTSWLDAMNMQVVDGNGKVLDHHKIRWSQFGSGYFPYILRQSTGCDNALGVIKFNIDDPYGVYLHDTNNKNVFKASSRFFSHGCIRVEKPLELGSYLLHEKLDTTFLQSCFKDLKPIPLSIGENIPVFVVYMTVETDSTNKVRYYKDVYKLLK